MRDENSRKNKLSWPKSLVKKWLNIKSKAEDFHTDDAMYKGGDEEWRNRFSEREAWTIKKSKTVRLSNRHSDRLRRSKIGPDVAQVTEVHNYRIFVATWNVAGKAPPSHMNLEDWFHTSPPADIYVLGFQEIVPLNAGNVLGTEDDGPARKWLALIRKNLNSGCHRRSFRSLSCRMRMDRDMPTQQPQLERRFSVCDRVVYGHRPSDWGSSDEENGLEDSPTCNNGSISMEDRDQQSRYCLVASKQMVGIFLTVWVKNDLRDDVKNMKVSCVGRGLMGYLGNKGSISISMSLHQTSFCFVCSHLTSGQKEGDEVRRNSDVMEILRKTRFPRVHGPGDENSPQTILEHDRIIWLGDLNYRIALPYRSTKALVEMRNWRALLENDQLQIEQRRGHVFEGWSEGNIYFPPTYKYSNNSDRYTGEDQHPRKKRRTPAWCDRILWYGNGLHQLSYVRGESRFSDHRPVHGIFAAEIESANRFRFKKSLSCSGSRIEVEELLQHAHGYTKLNFF